MTEGLILVSACLSGRRCRYDGTAACSREVKQLVEQGKAVPFCPETAGGLSVPRLPAEIKGGSGGDVLEGKAKVINLLGQDVSAAYVRGAEKGVELARGLSIRRAILKEKSPACGVQVIYDGSFKSCLVKGEGVMTAALKAIGVHVEGNR